jgi:hypothetical protein
MSYIKANNAATVIVLGGIVYLSAMVIGVALTV